MTTITPEHHVGTCHAASENRRNVLNRLKALAECLDECDQAAMKAAGCGGLFSSKKKRQVFPDPTKAPLITYPEFEPRESAVREPPNTIPPWEKPRSASSRELIGGDMRMHCDCTRKNGLQDQCELSQCHGRPLCLTVPEPLCPPSGGGHKLVTPKEAADILDLIDRDRCCRLHCCPGLLGPYKPPQ